MALFDYQRLAEELEAQGYREWSRQLAGQAAAAVDRARHGLLDTWTAAWNQLPDVTDARLEADSDVVRLTGSVSGETRGKLRDTLMAFHPWRKGPFEVFGIAIDTEWRSNLKWNRLAPRLDLNGANVLDVGCGNGYYGWKMLQAGARAVIGLDPFLLYVMQFEVFRRYADATRLHCVLPLSDQVLPEGLQAFDVTVSMGVLYHRSGPIEHLQALWHSLRPRGRLVLETLVIEDSQPQVLVPADRYAKMRNVWFIPSLPMLQIWLHRTGFRNVQVVDVTRTTHFEQRRTDWMTFESLSDFLDPDDPARTIEGYPGPVRALVLADRA